MRSFLDEFKYDGSRIFVKGWGAPERLTDTLVVRLFDEAGQEVPVEITRLPRPDVVSVLYGQELSRDFGFSFYYAGPFMDRAELEFSSAETAVDVIRIPLRMNELIQEYKRQTDFRHRAKRWLKAKDKKEFRLNEKYLFMNEAEKKYPMFYERTLPDKKTFRAHAKDKFPRMPLFSVLVPLYRPDPGYLDEMIASVRAQSYANWELILADGSPEDTALTEKLEALSRGEKRIRVVFLSENGGISENTNAALKEAKGDYAALLDQDDLLHPDALYEAVKALNAAPDAELLYTDEDKLDQESGLHYDPYFKPELSPALLLSGNYICHLTVISTALLKETGGFRKAFDGAQDHDLVLRATEKAKQVVHVPKVLYTWRVHAASTAAGVSVKNYATAAGKKAVEEALLRRGFRSEAVPIEALPGHFDPQIRLNEEPLVSVLIPNKDHAEMLERCVRSLKEVSTYPHLEIFVIENGSAEEETFRCYKELEEKFGVRVLSWTQGFNYAAINNFAAKEAKGEVLLLLNNDTEVISPDFLFSMLSWLQQEKTGAVGAKLLYEDGTLQHGGVLALTEGAAHHVYLGSAPGTPGYMGCLLETRNVSAVTGACLMISKSLYEDLGGMDERFTVAYNDVDLCLNILDRGLYVVFDASALLYHFESRSRGYEDTPEKKARQEREAKLLYEKHPERVDKDPYYSPQLSVRNGWYTLP